MTIEERIEEMQKLLQGRIASVAGDPLLEKAYYLFRDILKIDEIHDLHLEGE